MGVDLEVQLVLVLFLDSSLEQFLHVGQSRAIADRRLIVIQLNDHIVDLKPREGGQYVLYGTDLGLPVLKSGAAGNIDNMVDIRDDSWRARQVSAHKVYTMIRRGRFEGHRTLVAGM
jgi:hypothetical protein